MRADIAIITIREDEFSAVFDRLKHYSVQPFNGGPSKRTYAIISVPVNDNKTCIVALARSPEQGNDLSQQVASDMIQDLKPQILLVVGIAGGFPRNDFTLGDVIISSRIHNFNVNAINQEVTTFDVRGGIDPLVSNITASLPIYESSLAGWNDLSSIGMERPSIDLSFVPSTLYDDTDWQKKVVESLNTQFGKTARRSHLPLFKTGSVASSNSLMKDTKIPTKWLEIARSTLAVEMESAGVLQAAQRIGEPYPVMAIRGISDIVGLTRDDIWTSYACQSAGAFACAFIKTGIIQPRLQDSAPPTPSVSPRRRIRAGTGTTDSTKPPPLDLFISYSVDDERFEKELETHLAALRRDGTVQLHSQHMEAGLEVAKEIDDLINRSQIILLLISPSFLASDYHYEEMEYAMERHEADLARVVPIIIRSADMGNAPFSKLQGLPRTPRPPLDKSSNRDEAWTEIAKEIRAVCNRLRGA